MSWLERKCFINTDNSAAINSQECVISTPGQTKKIHTKDIRVTSAKYLDVFGLLITRSGILLLPSALSYCELSEIVDIIHCIYTDATK